MKALRQMPTLWVVTSLLLFAGGVAAFIQLGWVSMAPNSSNQSNKKLMVKKEESLDSITLFSVVTIMSFLLLASVNFFTEEVRVTPAYLQAAGLNLKQVYSRSLLAAICFHAYHQVAYMILERVSPVAHSVGNCVKHVMVILIKPIIWIHS